MIEPLDQDDIETLLDGLRRLSLDPYLRQVLADKVSALAALPVPEVREPQLTKENRMETVIYPCGCSATGTPSLPRYCPTHPPLTVEELNAAALLCERWGDDAFKVIDRVCVSLPTGCDWVTMTPELLDGLVAKLRAAGEVRDLKGGE